MCFTIVLSVDPDIGSIPDYAAVLSSGLLHLLMTALGLILDYTTTPYAQLLSIRDYSGDCDFGIFLQQSPYFLVVVKNEDQGIP